MDTGSHLLFGATLAGLAMLDPAIAQNPELSHAILTATLIGSHAPDFDSVTRLKGYSAYIRFHRGVTHSLPAMLLWPCIITLPIAAAFDVWSYAGSLFLWSFLAVVFHITLDWFNAYGVQCFRPVSNKWSHLDFMSLFDPFLFIIHGVGLLVWIFSNLSPGMLFLDIYGVSMVYMGARAIHHRQMVAKARETLQLDGIYQVIPGLSWFRWQFVIETSSLFYTGTIRGKEIAIEDVYRKDATNSAIQATLSTDGVRAFLYFAQRVHVCCKEIQDGYMVEWRDVRFWYNHKLPFGVDIQLDHNLQVVDQSLGWRKKTWEPPYV
ncbi:metal-dependent hydrolase [Paenibacillus sp. LMG 31456]|uniref:Metal-dependent hydrolase n=1 Tax=Paenibacillus foliorum TaxID=2654974 RepID=A0A972GZD4_9BACL|nr:metal-dependent hydrolase [Paenibacillus foliorum]NOU96948.1 metal-dependent hydrolase [Paenibacillus foliorum]